MTLGSPRRTGREAAPATSAASDPIVLASPVHGSFSRCRFVVMRTVLKILTAWNLVLPGLFLALLVGVVGFDLGIGRGDALDLVAYGVAWTWVISTPITGLAGLALGWRRRVWWSLAVHALALALWSASFFFILLAPGYMDTRLAI